MARHRVFLEGGDPLEPTAARFLGPPARVIPSRPGDELTTPPLGDSRGFVHRRIIGAVGGFISGGPLGAVGGFIRGGRGGAPQPTPVPLVQAAIPMRAACPPGFFETPAGGCQANAQPESRLGPLRAEIGARGLQDGRAAMAPPRRGAPSNGAFDRPPVPTLAVTGQFGAGFEPSLISSEMLECPPGTILGKDEVCYNRRDLRNNERKWPKGRRPLLTGGEMRAISTAASAAKRLQKKQQQLRSLGLLKPLPKAKAPKMLAPGHHAHVAHDGSQHR